MRLLLFFYTREILMVLFSVLDLGLTQLMLDLCSIFYHQYFPVKNHYYKYDYSFFFVFQEPSSSAIYLTFGHKFLKKIIAIYEVGRVSRHKKNQSLSFLWFLLITLYLIVFSFFNHNYKQKGFRFVLLLISLTF